MKQFGVDVSTWQRGFDFVKAKSEGVKFAVLRAAYSAPNVTSNAGKDTAFEEQYTAAKNAGLPVGCYQYSMATSIAEAKSEAEFMLSCLKGKKFELPIYFDVEDDVQKRLGKRLLTDIVKTWCSIVESKGYFVGIYSSKSFFGEYLYDGELTAYTHWVAQWDTTCTYVPASLCGMWQFGGEYNAIRTTNVAGVVCDQNYMLTDFPTEIKKRGLNGYPKPTPTPAPKPTPKPTPSKEVLMNITGINKARTTNAMILITDGRASTGFNAYGTDVMIDGNGKIVNVIIGKANSTIPTGCICVSGHGTADTFLRGLKKGQQIKIG